MKSIKNKLLTGIILINCTILIGIIAFKLNFEDFYIKQTSKDLNNLGSSILSLAKEENKDKLINYIEENSDNNILIDVFDKNDVIIYSNNFKSMEMHNNQHMQRKNNGLITDKNKISQNLNSYIVNNKQGTEFLATYTQSKNKDYSIVCKMPISSIKNSVNIASNFLLIIFIPIILLGIFMAIWFSKKFTKPIIEITNISNKISNLDFDEKINIHTNDEVEVLGNSINKLSSKIKSTMDDLKIRNEKLEIMISNKIKQEKLKKEFVSSVSHELKTPITIINGYAEGLRSDILEKEEDKQFYIDVICEESEKMGVMVNDLLDLYKMESKTFKIEKKEIDIDNLIKSTLKKHEFLLKEKGISISLKLENTNVLKNVILGDELRIEQVLNNLLNNAISHVDLNKQIIISSEETNDCIKISVFNSGEKIDQEHLEKIWDSFVRIDKVRNSSQNRVGLGLAIVREIINLHNGECGVLNKESGVEFWIKLKKFSL